MRTLKETLQAAVVALDATTTDDKLIRVWRYKDAPPELQALSDNGGDEDWLAVVPDAIDRNPYISWLAIPCFGFCDVDQYPIAGAMVYIGCHA